MNKRTLRKVGLAALSGMTDQEISKDPARAMTIAQAAMRGALEASKSLPAATLAQSTTLGENP